MAALRRSAVAGATVCLLLGLGGAGCSETGGGFDLAGLNRPPAPITSVAPVPNSPANALRLLEWSYDNRSLDHYGELFSEDFRGSCSPRDSAGAGWRGMPWTREDEILSAAHLFHGGNADQPAALDIRLDLDRNLFIYPDPNYTSWDPLGRWHKNIRTSYSLSVVTRDRTAFEILGHENFYCVRGDSAVIPEELRLRGFGPDSARWYIRRWEDETAEGSGAARLPEHTAPARSVPLHAQPAGIASWCELKLAYR